MAGEWIAVDIGLPEKPEVLELVDVTGEPVSEVVFRLYRLWSWASVNTADGTARMTLARIARVAGGDAEFWQAVAEVGWLVVDGDTVTIPGWDRRFSQAAKARMQHRDRAAEQEERRGRLRSSAGSPCASAQERRGEDRREEEYIPAAPVPTSGPAKPARSRSKSSVAWSAEAGWEGITDADRQEWAAAFPGAVLAQELAKANAWLKANPQRAGRRNWRRFLVGWLQRCQDKGGTNRTPGERPGVAGSAPVPLEKRRYWRGKAGRSMTDDEYQAWMAAQARAGPTSDGQSVGDLLARRLTEVAK